MYETSRQEQIQLAGAELARQAQRYNALELIAQDHNGASRVNTFICGMARAFRAVGFYIDFEGGRYGEPITRIQVEGEFFDVPENEME